MAVKLDKKDYIWSYLGTLFSVGSGIILLPFILHYLSADMYGLWGVFQSIAAITALFDFGFSTTFARNINYCWCGVTELKKQEASFTSGTSPNFVLMKRILLVCRYVFLILSGAALIFMAIPGTIYIRYICRNIAGPEPLIAWGFYVVAVFLNLYFGYFNSFLRGVGAISAINRVTIVTKCVQIITTIVLLACGLGIIGTGIAYLLYGFIFRILCKRSFLAFHGIGDGLKAVQARPTKGEIRELFGIVWYNAGREGIITLSNYLANQACTIIIPIFLPLSVTGAYSLAVQLTTVLSNVSGALYTANQPVLQSAYVSKDREGVRRTMSLIVISFVLVYAIGLIAIILFGLPILRLIKPDTIPAASTMLGVGIYQFVLQFRNCYTSYFSCTNRILYVKSFIVSSVLCVVLALGMLYAGTGVWGLILAQIVSQVVYNVWHWPVLAHHEMRLSAKELCGLGTNEFWRVIVGFFKK